MLARVFRRAKVLRKHPRRTALLHSSAVSSGTEEVRNRYVRVYICVFYILGHGCVHAGSRASQRKNNSDNICFYFYPAREYSSTSERNVTDVRDGKCEKCSITV